ncbi:Esterase-like activity of phytase [Tepidimonas alkaliphilus]|uniref:Esterase-like activity of phytase n=2 Tax=Tepidimonas alkaliphilus TaxID=2588942 RepID=A0A554W7V8_9BURK|nr:Esterase-like activity of phytase [Tepidimonas alkaliphilus]
MGLAWGLGLAPAWAGGWFERVAVFEAARNAPAGTEAKPAVAEIVAASADGRWLLYTDSQRRAVGLVDLRDPARPRPGGLIEVSGEPTSVAVRGRYAWVVVDQTTDHAMPQGELLALDWRRGRVVERCPLFGQPDAIAFDPQGRHAVIVIENERDEKLDKGKLPQLPGGNLSIVPVRAGGLPDCTRIHPVSLSGLAAVAPQDPEPEFVHVNRQGLAVVSLQENNHLVLVDVARRQVVGHFSAGAVDLDGIDATTDGRIVLNERRTGLVREPDAVAWLDDERFVTANEGDWVGGSRGITIFDRQGRVLWDSGALLEHWAVRLGHYPDKRSRAKGNEPEGLAVGTFGGQRLFFVGSERSSLVTVWHDEGPGRAPMPLQALPALQGPEGLLALPKRGLLVVASEVDKGARAGLTIYRWVERPRDAAPPYPMLQSDDDAQGRPIPWGALSGLAADPQRPGRLWAVSDSFFAETYLYEIDATRHPARIVRRLTVTRDGQPVGYDGEGIAVRADGGFWLASEGDPDAKGAPRPNLLIQLDAEGRVVREVALPEAIARHATRFGLEGVAVTGRGADEAVWAIVQREWKDDPKGHVKLLRYRPASGEWGVWHVPLETPRLEGSWVGMSELVAVGDDAFVLIERDNQFGPQALKRLSFVSVRGVAPAAPGQSPVPVLAKRLVRDVVPDLAAHGGFVPDKLEGLTRDAAGHWFAVTDNDGVDGSNGETMLLRWPTLALP